MVETVIGDVKVLQREIKQAQRIQTLLLTAKQPEVALADIRGVSVPARMIGGDYYDFYRTEDGRLRLIIADVMGKGIPAAMLMILTRGAFRSACTTTKDPSQTLTVMNDALIGDLRRLNSFVTACCAEWNPAAMTLTYAIAGHSSPICIREGKVIQTKTTNGVFLGGLPNQCYASQTIKLQCGDYVIFYTDGIIEAQNQKGELFKLDRLIHAALEQEGRSIMEIETAILHAIEQYTSGLPQKDDITMVIVKITDRKEENDV